MGNRARGRGQRVELHGLVEILEQLLRLGVALLLLLRPQLTPRVVFVELGQKVRVIIGAALLIVCRRLALPSRLRSGKQLCLRIQVRDALSLTPI